MEDNHSKSSTILKQEMQDIPDLFRVLKRRFYKTKEPKIIYEVVGTEEKNQEKLDRVFDKIFDEALRRREGKSSY